MRAILPSVLLVFSVGLCAIPAISSDFVVAGFTGSRGGAYALSTGSNVPELRSAIYNGFIDVAVADIGTISADDYGPEPWVFFFSSIRSDTQTITPLTANEQAHFLNSILAGNGAVLFVDNSNYNSGNGDAAHESLIDAFGLDVTGTLNDTTFVDLSDPLSPLADGPFGQTAGFQVYSAGWFDNLGPYAQAVGINRTNHQPMAAVIPRNAIAPGSGAVVIFSDSTMLNSNYFNANRTLVLNAVAYAACLLETQNPRGPTRTQCAGADVTFTYGVIGEEPIRYQWEHDGVALVDGPTPSGSVISGAATGAMTISNISFADIGEYNCAASNDCATVTGRPASLHVRQRGDMNCDCSVNNFDIDLFVLAMIDPDEYQRQYPDCNMQIAADVNGDGRINNFDIDPFVLLLAE